MTRPTLLLAALLTLVSLCGPATAADARAVADTLIRSAGRGNLFQRVEAGGMAAVQHRASGLVCLYFTDSTTNTLSAESGQGLARGEDISCSTSQASVNIITFVTRYPDHKTLDVHTTALAADMARNFSIPAPAVAGQGETRALTLKGKMGNADMMARINTAQVGDWILSIIVLAPASAEATIDQVSQGLLAAEQPWIARAGSRP